MAERADQPTPRGIVAASGGHTIIRNGVVEGAAASAAAPRSRMKTAPERVSRSCNAARKNTLTALIHEDAERRLRISTKPLI
jgi:hypothetical protein